MLQATVLPQLPLETLLQYHAPLSGSSGRKARTRPAYEEHEALVDSGSSSSSSNTSRRGSSDIGTGDESSAPNEAAAHSRRSSRREDIIHSVLRSSRSAESNDSGDDSSETEGGTEGADPGTGPSLSIAQSASGPPAATALEQKSSAERSLDDRAAAAVAAPGSGRCGPLEPMWRAAPSLRDLCQRSLAQQVNLRTAIPLLAHAETLNCAELAGFCEEFILRYGTRVITLVPTTHYLHL